MAWRRGSIRASHPVILGSNPSIFFAVNSFLSVQYKIGSDPTQSYSPLCPQDILCGSSLEVGHMPHNQEFMGSKLTRFGALYSSLSFFSQVSPLEASRSRRCNPFDFINFNYYLNSKEQSSLNMHSFGKKFL